MDVFYSEMSTLFAVNLVVNMVFYVGIIVIAVNANSKVTKYEYLPIFTVLKILTQIDFNIIHFIKDPRN